MTPIKYSILTPNFHILPNRTSAVSLIA